jgi:hypothetical protein
MEFFQINVTFKHTKPPIWRRIIVAPDINQNWRSLTELPRA